MRNMKLRLISAALATCMMASVLPASAVTAFADDVNNSVVASEEDPMGTLIPNNNGAVYEITQAGTYQMHGTYDAPVVVKCDDVTINITGDVDYTGTYDLYQWENYAIRVGISDGVTGNVTINNDGHTVCLKGNDPETQRSGVLYVWESSRAVVDGGYYQSTGTYKEAFYNNHGTLTLKDVNAEGEILVKNRGGTTRINGGVYKRVQNTPYVKDDKTAIDNNFDGTLYLENVEASSEQGAALLNRGGNVTVTGGNFATKDETYSAIYAYAEQVLGKGVAVPKTREDVALKAWELAGKPAVAVEGEPLSEAAQAEKWAVESGLMQNDAEGSFNGAKKMNKLKALRVLDAAKKLNTQ